jgi:hypothetical protein
MRKCEPENKREISTKYKRNEIWKNKRILFVEWKLFHNQQKNSLQKTFVQRDVKIDKDQTILDYQQRFYQQK